MKKKHPGWLLVIIQYFVLLLFNCANIAGIIFFSIRYLPFFKHYNRDFGIAESFPDTFFVLFGGAIVDNYFLFVLPFIILFLIFEIFYKKGDKVNVRSWIIVLQIIYILFLTVGVMISGLDCFHFASQKYRDAAIDNYQKSINQKEKKIPNEGNATDDLQPPPD